MRTTLELDDELHALVRRRAFEERRSIGDVISELALRGLSFEQRQPAARALGRHDGMIHVAADFNDTPDEVLEALQQPLS